ncbi:proton-conducting transporter membrane subunit [Bacillus licheniformis]|nr:proton-conducting transporter membrane subunit [Bacillus licheniformis]
MLGVVLVDNVIVLYLFWELTSISSFLLIGYWYKRENQDTARQIDAYHHIRRSFHAWRLHSSLHDHRFILD